MVKMWLRRTSGWTYVSGHTVSSNSSWVTSWPACAIRYHSTANALGGSRMRSSPAASRQRQRHWFTVSSRKGGNSCMIASSEGSAVRRGCWPHERRDHLRSFPTRLSAARVSVSGYHKRRGNAFSMEIGRRDHAFTRAFPYLHGRIEEGFKEGNHDTKYTEWVVALCRHSSTCDPMLRL